jgi:hypothetical protein
MKKKCDELFSDSNVTLKHSHSEEEHTVPLGFLVKFPVPCITFIARPMIHHDILDHAT